MSEFKVDFHYTEMGSTIVKANTAHEAEIKVEKELEMNGLEEIISRTNDREYGVTHVRTVGKSLFDLKTHPPS